MSAFGHKRKLAERLKTPKVSRSLISLYAENSFETWFTWALEVKGFGYFLFDCIVFVQEAIILAKRFRALTDSSRLSSSADIIMRPVAAQFNI